MKELRLSARIESINGGHASVGVFQNGGKAGVLIVDAEHAEAVVAAIQTGPIPSMTIETPEGRRPLDARYGE